MYYHNYSVFVKLSSYATPHTKETDHRSNNTSSNTMVDAIASRLGIPLCNYDDNDNGAVRTRDMAPYATPHTKVTDHRSNNASSNSMVDADWGYGNAMTIAMAMELF